MQFLPKSLLRFYMRHAFRPYMHMIIPWFFLLSGWRLIDRILLPWLEKQFISKIENATVLNTDIFEFLLPVVLMFFLALMASLLIHIIDDIVWMRLRTRVMNNVSEVLTDYVHSQSVKFWKNRIVGKIHEQIAHLSKGFEFLVTIMVRLTAVAVISINVIILFKINQQLAFVFSGIIGFYTLYCLVFVNSMTASNKAAANSYSTLTGALIDSFSNFMAVKLFANRDYEKSRLKEVREEFIKNKIHAGMVRRAFWGIPLFIRSVLFCALISFCAMFYIQGTIDISDIFFVLTVNAIIVNQIEKIIQDLPVISESLSAAKQAYDYLNVPISVSDSKYAKELNIKHNKIEIKNLNFHHSYSHIPVLKNISLTVKNGEKIGVVGVSGAGKSTLVNLLLRLYDPSAGEILIDGQNIKNISQDSLHKTISFVPQDTTIFNRSIRDNIAYGNTNADMKEIKKAAKNAAADGFIMDAPNKYNTIVGDRGIKLSGGQRQRIAIARAFLKNSPILILDEATSALDSQTEESIQKSLEKLFENKTTIAIAHRLSTLRNMDRIIVMDQGEIVEMGSHLQLCRKKRGIYATMWKKQSDGFIGKIGIKGNPNELPEKKVKKK